MDTNKIYAESIVNEYSKKEDSKVVRLKKLDRKVKTPANILAYTLGIISSLILGVGMCLAMKVIGDGSLESYIIGIVVGLIGILGVIINYPIYNMILNKRKNKYASDIIELAKDIEKEN